MICFVLPDPGEPGVVGERDRLRGPDSRTGVRIAGRSDMKISEESHGHVASVL